MDDLGGKTHYFRKHPYKPCMNNLPLGDADRHVLWPWGIGRLGWLVDFAVGDFFVLGKTGVEGDFLGLKTNSKIRRVFYMNKTPKVEWNMICSCFSISGCILYIAENPFPTASNIRHEFGIGKTQGHCPTISDRPGWCSSWWILWCCLWKWWGFNRDMKRRPGLFVKNGNLKLSRLNISPQFWKYSSI